jgi:UDP-GlcNAc:undecaprenyl-phosphate GlcNAc-1-phosphate transferase
MIPFLALLFAATFLLTADLVPWFGRLAARHGLLDYPGPRKIHDAPIPYGGGLAVGAGVLIVLGAGVLAALLHLRCGWFPSMPDDVTACAPGVFVKLPTLAVYALGSLVILGLGLYDDRAKLSAGYKLLVQTVVAAGVAVGGERLELFTGDAILGSTLTVLWIVGVTNAFNLLDHMDGLSSGVAGIACMAFLVVAVQTGQLFIAATLSVLLGACAAFLLFNFPPAKIFLGDAGSLFIGFWLSCLMISFTFYEAGNPLYPLYTYLVPLAVLAVPLFDTASVVLIRLRNRSPLFEGDTNHLAHRLVRLGMSPRLAVLAVYALTLYGGLSAALLYHVDETGAIIILSQLLLTFAIITLLEAAGGAHAESP